MLWLAGCVAAAAIGLLAGCARRESTTADAAASRSGGAAHPASPERRRGAVPVERAPVVRRTITRSSRSAAGDLSPADAVQRVLTVLEDTIDYAPTLVVWLLDVSPSSMRWGGEIRGGISRFYEDVSTRWPTTRRERLESAVWIIGREPGVLIPRSSNPQDAIDAVRSLRADTSGREATFAALDQALQRYLDARVRERRELLLVVVTDEAGDDWQRVDALVAGPRKYAIPVYVLGVPAPFGRRAALDASVEAAETGESGDRTAADDNAWQPILQGPESRDVERIALEYDGYADDLDLLDSGFGPFALERICRASGGEYLAVRRGDDRSLTFGRQQLQWPIPGARTFDPEVMRRYLPEPLDGPAYQQSVEQNAARRALHQVAQLPRAAILRDPQLRFVKRDEADLKNMLDKAQQAAAKVAPAVDQLYEILREGARDADQLQAPRLRAGYDLALGRVCAAKARIDGYNSMLAALKRGKSFERETSTTWVLQRAESTDAGSSLQNLIARGYELLRRVVDEHPGTPWAVVAEQELATPLGWQWTEE